tara:strand:+ start:999 stop:1244 length:246 start_codon:yes stop_codon:yes gene_type:complete
MKDNNVEKLNVLAAIVFLNAQLKGKVREIERLDRDTSTSGAFDVVDQITTMEDALERLAGAVSRAQSIVPFTKEKEDNDNE